MTASVAPGPDGLLRCAWCLATPQYTAYHDTEWGFPQGDDRALFEKLCLEGFQAGLSWRTILEKRFNFRRAFANFDIATLTSWGPSDVDRLLQDAGIVRHRGKIAAVLHNAQRAQALIAEQGSLAHYLWQFAPSAADMPAHRGVATSPCADALSRDLKKRGWKFVGPTTVHSFMQAMGFIDDHAPDCAIRARAEAARQRFQAP